MQAMKAVATLPVLLLACCCLLAGADGGRSPRRRRVNSHESSSRRRRSVVWENVADKPLLLQERMLQTGHLNGYRIAEDWYLDKLLPRVQGANREFLEGRLRPHSPAKRQREEFWDVGAKQPAGCVKITTTRRTTRTTTTTTTCKPTTTTCKPRPTTTTCKPPTTTCKPRPTTTTCRIPTTTTCPPHMVPRESGEVVDYPAYGGPRKVRR